MRLAGLQSLALRTSLENVTIVGNYTYRATQSGLKLVLQYEVLRDQLLILYVLLRVKKNFLLLCFDLFYVFIYDFYCPNMKLGQ